MNNYSFLKRKKNFVLILISSLVFQFCQPSKQISSGQTPKNRISYGQDIKPIMLKSCTPCHFPEKGKKKMLDTYEATKSNIDEILVRIQLPKDSLEFMPYKSKRDPLTSSEIKLFKDWVARGMKK